MASIQRYSVDSNPAPRNAILPVVVAVLALASLLSVSSVVAKDLTSFRKPNQLEFAYIGVAADLQLPEMCEKISPNALHRVRKPNLARSHCYYYLAVNSADLSWCDKVTPIPYGAGVMNWLDPERCRYQAGRLIQLKKPFPFDFDHEHLLRELGYSESDLTPRYVASGTVAWKRFYQTISSGKQREGFLERLQKLPDFSNMERAEDQLHYYTAEQKERELDWVMSRAMRLCVQGRISKDCAERFAQFRYSPAEVDNEAMVALGLKKGSGSSVTAEADDQRISSGYRKVSDLERAYYDMAVRFNNPDLCRKIPDNVIGIGWSIDPGFLMIPVRSACLTALAAKTKDRELCSGVQPVQQDKLDGYGFTSEYCLGNVDDFTKAVHESTLRPDWEQVLRILGYAEEDIPQAVQQSADARSLWLSFADHLISAENPQRASFLDHLQKTASHAGSLEQLDLSENDLNRHLYQLQLIRFHCSINRYGDRYLYKGYELEPPKKFGGPFELVNHHGETVTEEDFYGKHLLVFFGYTFCPDICPTNMVTIANVLEILGELGESVQPIFISVDAKRDSPEKLATYVNYFHPQIVGMTGTAQQIRRAAKAYQAQYFAGDVDGEYVVDHTAWTYFVGPDGRPINYFDHGIDPLEMATQIEQVLLEGQRHAFQADN